MDGDEKPVIGHHDDEERHAKAIMSHIATMKSDMPGRRCRAS
jgi:hypothetical protein